MVENSIKINCHFCLNAYEIIFDNDERPEYCSYCGELIDLKDEEDDNWDN